MEGCGRGECREVVRGFSEWAFVWGPRAIMMSPMTLTQAGMVPMMQISSLISGVIDDDPVIGFY